MSDSEDGMGPLLPAELVSALQRTTAQTLNALHSLRVSLREHVHSERSRGASLAEIDGCLREMIGLAGGDADDPHYSPERITELTTQVLKWSKSFYSPAR